MRVLLMAAASLALFAAAPAFADDSHHPGDPAPATTPAPEAAPPADAKMHEMCMAMMGDRMDPKAPMAMGGAMTGPDGKPMSMADMEAMHKKCAAMMAKGSDAPPPPAAPKPQ